MKLTLEHLDYCAKYRAECYGEDLEISKEKLRRKISKGKINLLWPGKGYIILRDDYDNPGYAHISAILVEKKHQGKGYGTLILKRAEEEAKKQGFKGVTLSVRPRAEQSIHSFYLKNGYEKVREEKGRCYYSKTF